MWPENRQSKEAIANSTQIHSECCSLFIDLDGILTNFKSKLLPLITMPSEITIIKYKCEQQFSQNDKMADFVGRELMEFVTFYDYKSNESLLEKFWKLQKCVKKIKKLKFIGFNITKVCDPENCLSKG